RRRGGSGGEVGGDLAGGQGDGGDGDLVGGAVEVVASPRPGPADGQDPGARVDRAADRGAGDRGAVDVQAQGGAGLGHDQVGPGRGRAAGGGDGDRSVP